MKTLGIETMVSLVPICLAPTSESGYDAYLKLRKKYFIAIITLDEWEMDELGITYYSEGYQEWVLIDEEQYSEEAKAEIKALIWHEW